METCGTHLTVNEESKRGHFETKREIGVSLFLVLVPTCLLVLTQESRCLLQNKAGGATTNNPRTKKGGISRLLPKDFLKKLTNYSES